jgi:hypothetical protein
MAAPISIAWSMGSSWGMRYSRTTTLGVPLVLGLAAAFLAGWILSPADSAGPCTVVSGPAMLPEIPETSGLAVSRRNPGLLWSHNDSGSAAVLFALDGAGMVRGRVRLPIRTRDWEDVSSAPCGSDACLYIADIGDNRAARREIQIYRVLEPAPVDAETAPPQLFTATYADGPHNAEAMFVIGADLFIITRDRTGGVYRADLTTTKSRELKLRHAGTLGLAAVTDAEPSRDEKSVVVRTSHEAVFYRTADLIHGTAVPYLRVPLDGLREPQGEGVALDGNMLHLSSEGRPWNRAGRLVSLSCTLPE